ncbi:MAG: hypothetical protein U0235_24995 [Polyangiaceae bacterium]
MPLTASGGAVATYHPVRALVRKLDLARLDRRDHHRKILVVDGEVGFLEASTSRVTGSRSTAARRRC